MRGLDLGAHQQTPMPPGPDVALLPKGALIVKKSIQWGIAGFLAGTMLGGIGWGLACTLAASMLATI